VRKTRRTAKGTDMIDTNVFQLICFYAFAAVTVAAALAVITVKNSVHAVHGVLHRYHRQRGAHRDQGEGDEADHLEYGMCHGHHR
jgi:hypothetical protein